MGKEGGWGLAVGVGLELGPGLGLGVGRRWASTSEMGYALGHGSNVNVVSVDEVLGDASRRASSNGDMSTSWMCSVRRRQPERSRRAEKW